MWVRPAAEGSTCVKVPCVFAALATLKPQAGLVAPQAVPASQPSAVVSPEPGAPTGDTGSTSRPRDALVQTQTFKSKVSISLYNVNLQWHLSSVFYT